MRTRKLACEIDWHLVIEKKLLKFEAEGQEFAKILRSVQQFNSNSESGIWKHAGKLKKVFISPNIS